jgi:hydrogenase expression/formation protein HypC
MRRGIAPVRGNDQNKPVVSTVGWSVPCTPKERKSRMCLGVPGKITEIYEQNGVRMAKADFGGVSKEICLAYLPEIGVGDYTIVHVGFAITQLDEESAQESLRLFREMGLLEEEFGAHPPEGEQPHEVPG